MATQGTMGLPSAREERCPPEPKAEGSNPPSRAAEVPETTEESSPPSGGDGSQASVSPQRAPNLGAGGGFSWREVPLPATVAALPRDRRGFPVLFTAVVRPDGTPDFRVSDPLKRARCVTERLCGICGAALTYWSAFIAGPLMFENRIAGDPPMHEACARYALRVCPYLVWRDAERKADEHGTDDLGGIRQKPGSVVLWVTRSWEVLAAGGDSEGFVFRAAPAKRIEVIPLKFYAEVRP